MLCWLKAQYIDVPIRSLILHVTAESLYSIILVQGNAELFLIIDFINTRYLIVNIQTNVDDAVDVVDVLDVLDVMR